MRDGFGVPEVLWSPMEKIHSMGLRWAVYVKRKGFFEKSRTQQKG